MCLLPDSQLLASISTLRLVQAPVRTYPFYSLKSHTTSLQDCDKYRACLGSCRPVWSYFRFPKPFSEIAHPQNKLPPSNRICRHGDHHRQDRLSIRSKRCSSTMVDYHVVKGLLYCDDHIIMRKQQRGITK